MELRKLWRKLEFDFEYARAHCPEGYTAVVELSISGRAPIQPVFVETDRSGDSPWVRFQVSGPEADADDDAPLPPDSAWIYAHSATILGGEVRFEPATPRGPLGFTVRSVDNDQFEDDSNGSSDS